MNVHKSQMRVMNTETGAETLILEQNMDFYC